MPVNGIGGLFFRAADPDALSAWYREHLGIGAGCVAEGTGDPDEWSWMTQGGPVVFARCNTGHGVDEVIRHVLAARAEALAPVVP